MSKQPTTTRPRTLAEAREILRALGISLRKTDRTEFRVNFSGGEEATACYESDLPSAVDTGRAMAKARSKLESLQFEFDPPDE